MLERTDLRIGPWIPSAEAGRWQRSIHDGPGMQALGKVRTRDRLLPFLRRLEVCETDDDALVMSLAPAWFGGAWHVRDSEGSYVGTLLPDALLDPAGRRFAERVVDGPDRWRLREPAGREYATLDRGAGGMTLRFTDRRLTNPFLRMMVLGNFLLLDPLPRTPRFARHAGSRRLD